MLIAFPVHLFSQNGCNFFDHRKIEIEKTTLNTVQSDFGPAFVNDELWFSAFTDEEIVKLSEGKTKGVFYNLYSSKVDDDGNITGPKKSQLENISAGYHAGPVSWCEKTKELFNCK